MRLRSLMIPQVAESYSRCLGDVDLEALYSVLAYEYWSKPMAYLQVNLAAADAGHEARTTLALPGKTRWSEAFGKIKAANEKGRGKVVKPFLFTTARN